MLGGDNPADMCTKHLDWTSIGKHTAKLNCESANVRASEAPQLHEVNQSMWGDGDGVDRRHWPLLDEMLAVISKDENVQGRKRANGHFNSLITGQTWYHTVRCAKRELRANSTIDNGEMASAASHHTLSQPGYNSNGRRNGQHNSRDHNQR